MHYHCEVWIPNNQNVEEEVSEAMEPYSEELGEKGFWDWYQIGGRWKGSHVPGYDPDKDPANLVSNRITGTLEIAWPTKWIAHTKDIIPVSEIPDSLSCATLILPDKVFKYTEYIPDGPTLEERIKKTPFNTKEELKARGLNTGYLVTVDYHS